MNKFILDRLLIRFNNKQTQFMISSLSYYAILALIPTVILTITILRFFDIEISIKYQNILNLIKIGGISNIIVFILTLYMISRVFFTLVRSKFSLIKSLLFSLLSSLLTVIFLSLFFTTYTLENNLLSILFKLILLSAFFFILIKFSSESNLKYSIIFSLSTSVISNIFIYGFSLITSFFLNYESYYGILAPIFIIILTIHIFINITFFAFIGAEEFTKISKMKFIKS